MSYNDTVSALRTFARDELRMKAINRMRDSLLSVENQLSDLNKRNDEYLTKTAKELAVLTFKTAQLEDADPEKQEKAESYANLMNQIQEEQVRVAKDFAKDSEFLNKQVAEWTDKISKLESGETKVSKEGLEAVTERLIEEVVTQTARENLAELSQKKA